MLTNTPLIHQLSHDVLVSDRGLRPFIDEDNALTLCRHPLRAKPDHLTVLFDKPASNLSSVILSQRQDNQPEVFISQAAVIDILKNSRCLALTGAGHKGHNDTFQG